MGDNIISLDDHREHFVIPGLKDVHVVPRVMLEKIAEGKLKVEEIEDINDFLPTVITEWLIYERG